MSIKEQERRLSALILYHFFHPDDVISSQHFSQFAEELAKRKWVVTVLTSNRYCRYPDKKINQKTEWWQGVKIIRIYRPGWNQAGNFLRIINSLWMMSGWIIRLLRMPRFDVVIIGTDPQFSAILFPLVKFLRRGKILAHWCYDLYPEAVIADGTGGFIVWVAKKMTFLMRWAYQSVNIMVDIGQCMRKRLSVYNHRSRCATLVPWALVEPSHINNPDPDTRHELFSDATTALLYSGNMGRAHDFSLFIGLARKIFKRNPKIIFCFACRGNRMKELTSSVMPDDYNIRIVPFTQELNLEKRLSSADIHLLSLKSSWEGIVVPSKFFGSLAVGRPVIYSGGENSAITRWIKEFKVGLILTKDNMDLVVEELLNINDHPDALLAWKKNAFNAYHEYFSKKIVMDQWDELLRDVFKQKQFL